MMNLWGLLTVGLLTVLPVALYVVWFRRAEWTRTQRLYGTFAVLASASVLLLFGDVVGVRLPGRLDLVVLGVGWASLASWAYLGAKLRDGRFA